MAVWKERQKQANIEYDRNMAEYTAKLEANELKKKHHLELKRSRMPDISVSHPNPNMVYHAPERMDLLSPEQKRQCRGLAAQFDGAAYVYYLLFFFLKLTFNRTTEVMNFARELFCRNQTPMTSCQQRQAEERRQLQQLTPPQPEVIDLTEEGIQFEINLYQERMAYLQLLSVIRAILRDTMFTALPHGYDPVHDSRCR